MRLSSVSIASGPKSWRLVAARERVCLVDEEDAVERALDRAVGLDRGRADVLADEPGAVDLDEVAALQQAHRAVHLREQPRDGRLARAGIAEEDEVLARRDLGEAVLLPARLHLEEGDQRAHLLLHGLEPDERVELDLKRGERERRLRLRDPDLIGDVVADGLAHALADRAERVGRVLERVPAHAGTLARNGHLPSAEAGPRCQEVISKVVVGFAVAAGGDPAFRFQPGVGAFDRPAVSGLRVACLELGVSSAPDLAGGRRRLGSVRRRGGAC